MIKGKTKSGFSFKANENVIKSFVFIRKLAMAQEDAKGYFEAMDNLLGEEQVEALAKHCGEYAPLDAVIAEFDEIVGIIKEKSESAKNS